MKKILSFLVMFSVLAISFGISPANIAVAEDTKDAPGLMFEVVDGGGGYTYLGGARAIELGDKYVYIASSTDDSITIIDVSDADAPVKQSESYDGDGTFSLLDEPYGLHLDGNNLYVVSKSDNSLTIMDVSNPATPTLVSETTHANLVSPNDVYVRGSYAYIAGNNGSGDGIIIFDISTPATPVYLSSVYDGDGEFSVLDDANNVVVNGNYLYVSSPLDSAVTIMDISDRTDPALVAEIVDNAGGFARLAGANSVFFTANKLYVTSGTDHALTIIDVSTPGTPSLDSETLDGAGSFTKLAGASSVVVNGDYAYVGSLIDHGMTIIDVSNTAAPVFVSEIFDGDGTFSSMGGVTAVQSDFNYAYIIGNTDSGFTIAKHGAIEVSLTTKVAMALSLDCGPDVDFGTLAPGTPVTGNTTCTVLTNAEDGYTLEVKREDSDTTMDHTTDDTANIADKTAWDPGTPNGAAYASPGLAFRVYSVAGATKNDTWWDTDTACPETGSAKYAGFPADFETIMTHSAYAAASTDTNVCYEVDVPASQKSGSYDGVITYQAYTNP